MLVRERGPVGSPGRAAFKHGLAEVDRFPQAQLLHRLFECRSRSLDGELAPQDAACVPVGPVDRERYRGGLDVFGELDRLSPRCI